MTATRESLVLPALFLTVGLLGGLRIAEAVRLVAPSLMTMVLAMLLVGCLVRTRALAPERLMNARRTPLENLSGLVVLLSLFAACAQVFNLVTPETGLLYLIFSLFFLVQLLTTLAAVRDRVSLLRALVVLLGSAFLIRFIVLEALYAPEGGTLKRVLTALAEGITLGTLEYHPHAAITGYVAFFTLMLFLAGLFLLAPDETHTGALEPVGTVDSPALRPLIIILAAVATQACSASAPPVDAAMAPDAAAARDRALASARVWQAPTVPVSQARLGDNPPGGWKPNEEIRCQFVFEPVGGTTPKFDCRMPDGEVVKVKYGRSNPEMYTEVAASRLLSALGFGSDRMFVVRRVRCEGCPTYPFAALLCMRETGLRAPCLAAALTLGGEVPVDYAVVERRLPGRRIEAFDGQGWAWYELENIDPAKGGAPRAHVDALRLIAVILAHWDNKAPNQRLVCPAGADRPDGGCDAPFAFMHDVGGTFGPTKLDLLNWRRVPVWKDARGCVVSMKSLPYNGATFPDAQVSEEGRRLLLGLLEQLSAAQLEQLFVASRMTEFDGLNVESRKPLNWVSAFRDKVRQLREGGPCPAAGPGHLPWRTITPASTVPPFRLIT